MPLLKAIFLIGTLGAAACAIQDVDNTCQFPSDVAAALIAREYSEGPFELLVPGHCENADIRPHRSELPQSVEAMHEAQAHHRHPLRRA